MMFMGSDIRKGAACAKAKAMYGMKITKTEYDDLITRNSIPDVVAFLKGHPLYKEVMKDANESIIRRSALESLIRKSLSADYKKLFYYMSDLDKETLKIFTLRSEIEFILRVIIQLRNKSGTDKAELMATIPQFYEVRHSEHMMSLLTAGTFAELNERMAKTKYAGVLDNFDLEKSDTAEIETALITHFYRMLEKFINGNYQIHEADELIRQFGMRIDIENIRRLIRLKKSFADLSYKKYIIGFGYRLSMPEIERVAVASEPAETLAGIIPLYGEYYNSAMSSNSDTAKDIVQFKVDRNILLTSKSAVSATIAYLGLKTIEIKNLFHIIESIRYGESPEEARKNIIGAEYSDSQ
jgi:V/A-type H+-transporting ATPase subunit C